MNCLSEDSYGDWKGSSSSSPDESSGGSDSGNCSTRGSDGVDNLVVKNQPDSFPQNQCGPAEHGQRDAFSNGEPIDLNLSRGCTAHADVLEIHEDLVVRCEVVLISLSKYNTQQNMDGCRNVWILKPGTTISIVLVVCMFVSAWITPNEPKLLLFWGCEQKVGNQEVVELRASIT